MRAVYLQAIGMAVPEKQQSNEELCEGVPGWTAEKIFTKTGIRSRRIARDDETACDLGVQAAEQLLEETGAARDSIDALILCTQSPDHFLPATACIMQDRLRLPTTCAALDINQGCSGYPYSLWLAHSLLLSGNARRVLVITADTYSKYCSKSDIAVASLFGDGAAATLLTNEPEHALAAIGCSSLGTDGSGAKFLRIPGGCHRAPLVTEESPRRLLMNGAAIASFAAGTVRQGIDRLLQQVGRDWSDIDRFFFHQANPGFVRRLTEALHLPAEKVPIDLADIGNTGSATIPMLLRRLLERGELRSDWKCVLAGFGTGLSWGMTYAEWMRPTLAIPTSDSVSQQPRTGADV